MRARKILQSEEKVFSDQSAIPRERNQVKADMRNNPFDIKIQLLALINTVTFLQKNSKKYLSKLPGCDEKFDRI